MNKWTVHITDFGKIKKADIQVAPLTFFVGDNNSGKSYMMTLIYGLLNLRIYFDKYVIDYEASTYQRCLPILEQMLQKASDAESTVYCLQKKEIKVFQDCLNEILYHNKKKFFTSLFNKDIDIHEWKISFEDESDYKLVFDQVYNTEQEQDMFMIYGLKDSGSIMSGYGIPKEELEDRRKWDFLIAYIMEYMLKKDFVNGSYEKAVYFPTARSGFLLSYKSLVQSAMQNKFNLNQDEKNLLTRPNSDFLTMLSSMSIEHPNHKYDEVIAFMEQKLINGHVGITSLPSQDILYTPQGEDKDLPMFLSSGVVTELTPVLLFLKYVNMGTMLIEEPEISLHPRLQWEMARVLIRLVNMDIPVLVTTHSDIIVQHLNNMVKLNDYSKKSGEKLLADYEKVDLIAQERTNVYQFEVMNDRKTLVTKLPCGEYGYEAMTFYKTLRALNDQVDEIENLED